MKRPFYSPTANKSANLTSLRALPGHSEKFDRLPDKASLLRYGRPRLPSFEETDGCTLRN